MSQMADVITKESVHRLHNAFIEGVLQLERTKAGDIKLNRKTFPEVGEPIVRFIHTKLWENSKPNSTGRFVDFSRVTAKSVNAILVEEGVQHTSSRDKNGHDKTVSLGGDVSRVMQNAGIALYRRPYWFLKPYSSERVQWWSADQGLIKVDYRDEKRMEEEAEKSESTLNSRIDLRQIQRPKEFTPEAVADFIERFVPAALRVQESYEKLQGIHAAVLDELNQKATEDEWKSVADVIDQVLSG